MLGSDVVRNIALTANQIQQDTRESKGTKYVQASQVKSFLRTFDATEMDIQIMFRPVLDGERLKARADELFNRPITGPTELLAWAKETTELFEDAFVVPKSDTHLRGTVAEPTVRIYKSAWNRLITTHASRLLGLT